MASIDDRIVQMQFDNKSFEEKIATTMGSLDKLKGSLDFANSKRGIDDLTAASNSFNLKGISDAVEGIGSKFSAMGVVAFTVLSSIVTKAFDTGVQIVKSMSLDQVLSGFHEYETNMNAIQTVMANTKSDGTTLDQVNAALQNLNTYSDKTIYNFSEMAKNIGTFTAAGVDLDTSVGAIKGIANLAAVSGSSADQASSAMYQLSQAIAGGTLKLMDWNSVQNAGMGGEVFQKALFETGKAMGTLKNVPIGQTFEQWTKAGNTFRGSLEKGWITSEVLTNTLQGFTGDLTDAQLQSIGYTSDQIKEIQEMGKTGLDAATKVKTLSQLIGTVKESIGSGWTESFGIVFGTFDEARDLFTGLNDSIGAFVSKSSDARNALLKGWKDMGGRTLLIQTLKDAFHALAVVITPIKNAFRDMFPAATSQSLFNLTQSFHDLVQRLTLGAPAAQNLTHIFKGIFAALKIGWEVVKGVAGVFGDLFDRFKGEDTAGGGLLAWLAGIADKVVALKGTLVNGDVIKLFFENLATSLGDLAVKAKEKFDEIKGKVEEFIAYFKGGFTDAWTVGGGGLDGFANTLGTKIGDMKDKLKEFFAGFTLPSLTDVGDTFKTVGDKLTSLDGIGRALSATWDWLKDRFNDVKTAMGDFVSGVASKFKDLAPNIVDTLKQGDFQTVLDTIDTGLFAGIVLIFKNLVDKIPDLGIFDNLSSTLGELKDTLKAMQTEIKARALLEIAEALALLVVSMIAISLIDPEKIGPALTTMGIGLAALVTAMSAMDKLTTGVSSGVKLSLLAGGLILISGALLLLSLAVKAFSTMSWDELEKGLGSVIILLAALSLAVKVMSDNSSGMIQAGIGILAISVALNILAGAVKLFSMMNWEELGKGMGAIAVGLLAIVLAINNLPKGTALKGAGLIEIALALNILAAAVRSFASMEWGALAKGLTGVAGALLIIAGATQLMPNGASMALQGLGLLAISIGLLAISQALQSLATMSWAELGKSLVAVAASLLILAVAADAMSGSIGGAIAMGIVAVSLGLLADSLAAFGSVSWTDLLKGLVALAGVLLIFAAGAVALAPAIPAMLALGAALALLGAGFALFGVGASLVAEAFGILADKGSAGVKVLIEAISGLIKLLPSFIAALGDGLIELAKKIVQALPGILKGLDKSLQALIQLIIDNIPGAVTAIVTLIQSLLKAIRDIFPDIVQTGFDLLMSLLNGIKDNIGEIVTTVADIITNFLDALSLKIPELIDSVFNFLKAVVEGVIEKLADIGTWLWPKGVELIGGLLGGLVEKLAEVGNWFTELPGKILGWLGDLGRWLWNKGIDLIIGLLGGIVEKAIDLGLWWLALPLTILGWIGDVARWLWDKGKDFIIGLLGGIVEAAVDVISWFTDLPGKVLGWIGDVAGTLVQKGKDFLIGLLGGIISGALAVADWFKDLGSNIIHWIGDALSFLVQVGKDFLIGLLGGIISGAMAVMDWFKDLGSNVVGWIGDAATWLWDAGVNIIKGLWNGLESMKDWISDKISDMVDWITGPFEDILSIFSPSRVFAQYGMYIGQGLVLGLNDTKTMITRASGAMADYVTNAFVPDSQIMASRINDSMQLVLDTAARQLGNLEDINPTITPVLDLTQVQNGSKSLAQMLAQSASAFPISLLLDQANNISSATDTGAEDVGNGLGSNGPTSITFEQNNYSPEALSTSDIYRQTRSQIAMAKEAIL